MLSAAEISLDGDASQTAESWPCERAANASELVLAQGETRVDYIKCRTNITDHKKFLSAGALARDLWLYGMLLTGKHEEDGRLDREAVLASPWGAGTRKGNLKLANLLVHLGLWDETDDGWIVSKWSEKGNLTKDEIEATRAEARVRMAERRAEKKAKAEAEKLARLAQSSLINPTGSEGMFARTSSERSLDVPTSTSPSSCLESGERVQGEGATWSLVSEIPEAWRARAEAQVITSRERVDVPVEWSCYLGNRLRPEQTRSISDADWFGWIMKAIKYARGDRLRAEALERTRGPEPAKVVPPAEKPFASGEPAPDQETRERGVAQLRSFRALHEEREQHARELGAESQELRSIEESRLRQRAQLAEMQQRAELEEATGT